MNEEQVYERKAQFVQFTLAPFLVALTEGEVAGAWYERGAANEFVHVEFAGGHRKAVCVTGDSDKAITLDVVGAIG